MSQLTHRLQPIRDPEVEDLDSCPKKLRKQLKCCFKLLTFVVSCYGAIDNKCRDACVISYKHMITLSNSKCGKQKELNLDAQVLRMQTL